MRTRASLLSHEVATISEGGPIAREIVATSGDNKLAIVLIARKKLFYYTKENLINRQCRFP